MIEPEYWALRDSSARQWAFVSETLRELTDALAICGQPLVLRVGDVVDVLTDLHQTHRFAALWSHEETGNDWTFQRDKRVAAWCREVGLPWHELTQNGVQRRLRSRNGWAGRWDQAMATSKVPVPQLQPIGLMEAALPNAADLGMAPDPCPDRQPGGRTRAEGCLSSFLHHRGRRYRSAMSSPLEGAQACSRLSPHLAWGSLSMKEVAHATWARQAEIALDPAPSSKQWAGALQSFNGRLHWHCHFIQKLEDAPRLEYENMHRAYDGVRPSAPDAERLALWGNGETGLPFVDACMRCLRATGWLNFRMRAMVMAVASYHLWLDWPATGRLLARRFTDYEPGIHWSQVQMQSGTTGINTVRIYNPVKQGYDQDPTGAFTRRWVPELAHIADAYLQEPWKADNAGQVLGRFYPHPVVDHVSAARAARDRIWAVRKGAMFRDEARGILNQHGSRKSSPRRRKASTHAKVQGQLSLPFGD